MRPLERERMRGPQPGSMREPQPESTQEPQPESTQEPQLGQERAREPRSVPEMRAG
jgi:hypothetical protein